MEQELERGRELEQELEQEQEQEQELEREQEQEQELERELERGQEQEQELERGRERELERIIFTENIMKILLTLLLLVPQIAFAEPLIIGKSARLTWDAPTQYVNGMPLPAGTVLTYKVYNGATSRKYGTSPKLVGASTTTTITVSSYGTRYFAVKAYIGTVSSDYSNEAVATFTTVDEPINLRVE